MPDFDITCKYHQIHTLHWRGTAPSSMSAERQLKAAILGGSAGDDLSASGIQVTGGYTALKDVRVRELAPKGTPQARTAASVRPESDVLRACMTAWRSLTPQEQHRFLVWMQTDSQRLFGTQTGGAQEDEP